MNTECILEIENLLTNKECVICFNEFIKIKDTQYNKFLEYVIDEYNLKKNSGKFEDETTTRCYDNHFECLNCKNRICQSCIEEMPSPCGTKELDKSAMFDNGYTIDIYYDLTSGDTGIIKCPICRNVDYRRKYFEHNHIFMMSTELLRDIKNTT